MEATSIHRRPYPYCWDRRLYCSQTQGIALMNDGGHLTSPLFGLMCGGKTMNGWWTFFIVHCMKPSKDIPPPHMHQKSWEIRVRHVGRRCRVMFNAIRGDTVLYHCRYGEYPTTKRFLKTTAAGQRNWKGKDTSNRSEYVIDSNKLTSTLVEKTLQILLDMYDDVWIAALFASIDAYTRCF